MAGHDDATHRWLRKNRGRASTFVCPCGKQAYEWAYQHGGDPEDTDGYLPMCRSCHRKLDYEKSPVFRDSLNQIRRPFTREQQERGRQNRPNGHPGMRGKIPREDLVSFGRMGGLARSARMKEDKDLRSRLVESATRNLPLGRTRTCETCGLTSSVPGIGNHLKHSGHIGWKE